MSKIDARLNELGIVIPEAATPAANYVGYVISGNQIIISGQIPVVNGEVQYIGKVGVDYTADEAMEVAKVCAINIFAQAKMALDGDLDRVTRIVKLGGFVNAVDSFTEQPKVINGASDFMVEVFGKEIGSHSRAAVGVASLPFGVAVEIDAIIEFQ